MLLRWLAAFALTQLIEAPIYARALRERRWRWAWALLPSTLTHPFIFLALPALWPGAYAGYFAAAEAIAVLGEAALLHVLRVPRPLLWSLAANAASTAAGALTRALTGWP